MTKPYTVTENPINSTYTEIGLIFSYDEHESFFSKNYAPLIVSPSIDLSHVLSKKNMTISSAKILIVTKTSNIQIDSFI